MVRGIKGRYGVSEKRGRGESKKKPGTVSPPCTDKQFRSSGREEWTTKVEEKILERWIGFNSTKHQNMFVKLKKDLRADFNFPPSCFTGVDINNLKSQLLSGSEIIRDQNISDASVATML